MTDRIGNFLVARQPGSDFQFDSRLQIVPAKAGDCKGPSIGLAGIPGLSDVAKELVKVESERYFHTYDQALDSTSLGGPPEPAIKLDGSIVRMGFWVERLDDVHDRSVSRRDANARAALSLLFCPFEAGVSRWFGEVWSLEQAVLRRTYVKIPGSPLVSKEGFTGQEWRRQWYEIPGWFIGGLLKIPAMVGDAFSPGWGSGIDMDVELAMDSYELRSDRTAIVPMARKSIALRFDKPSRAGTHAAIAWKVDSDRDGECDTGADGKCLLRMVKEKSTHYRSGGIPSEDEAIRIYVRVTEKNRFGSTLFEIVEKVL